MRYDGIVNPLYVDEKSSSSCAVPVDDDFVPASAAENGAPVCAEDVIGLVPLHKNRASPLKSLKRPFFVLFAVLLAASFVLFLPYGIARWRDSSAPSVSSTVWKLVDTSGENTVGDVDLTRSAASDERVKSFVEMPRPELFEAVLAAYEARYGEMSARLERALASWWSAPSLRARVHAMAAEDAVEIAELIAQFVDFQEKFKRGFDDFERRLVNFLKNLVHIRRLNEINASANTTFGVNDFADWSQEEFQQMLMPVDSSRGKLRDRIGGTFVREMNPIFGAALTDDYPAHFDWREKGVVTPVKNQQKCGSCWAFATAATVESAYAVAHGELRSLSEQELLDCNLENNACNGGDVDKAFRFVHEHGLMSEDAYPYVAQRQNTCALAGETTKIDVAYFINPDEKSIIDWLVNFGPVNIGIAVPPDMKPYTGGVYRPSDYDCKFRVLGLHALLIVGYGTSEDGEKYWIVKNSWGDTWGVEHGYVYFARGVNACGIEDEPIGLLA